MTKTRLKNLVFIALFAAFVIAPVVSIAQPTTTFAALPTAADQKAIDAKCEKRILGIPTWFRGLSTIDAGGNCQVLSPDELNTNTAVDGAGKPTEPSNGLSNFIWAVALNVIEIGLFLAGYVALGFILFGGFQFLTGGSNPSQIEKARKTILNAVIGLAISIASIAVVNLIFGLVV